MPSIISGRFCKELNLNKSTKIWLNTLAGLTLTALLFYSIWLQVKGQLTQVEAVSFWEGHYAFLLAALLLMPVNLSIEVSKWKLLAGSAQPISAVQAWKSYLAGIALSFLTPNRIGEYPGRILYLKRKNTIRLISVAILGAFAQFITLFVYGTIGLAYYNSQFSGWWQKLVLVGTSCTLLVLMLLFLRFESWAKRLENVSVLRRFQTYGKLIKRFTKREQFAVLGLSLLRFLVYSFQFLLLLQWMNISLFTTSGWMMTILYFWVIAIIPSIAFSELGIRGQVSLFLFQPYTQNNLGILSAAVVLWCINLIVPALLGSILLLRVRFLR